jgi:hypothetical protein
MLAMVYDRRLGLQTPGDRGSMSASAVEVMSHPSAYDDVDRIRVLFAHAHDDDHASLFQRMVRTVTAHEPAPDENKIAPAQPQTAA